ncbi:hypothetical protein CTKZ_17430 [Cellulomonas algicola]|uniref:Uncharacterized protein n=1 Tax=Cellulomonas algicola TaxID=2071633 RepID=A0A401UZR4_9CELL|nr:SIR2 family protein [Cellulomonas algicola]GCD20181.1 hypothetical protein CTKZ_17430 [Cellulomonas algicola]
MPDLVADLLGDMGLPEDTLAVFGDDLEAWLSYLSTSQPWDSDLEALRNQATFLQASRAIRGIVARHEAQVLDSSPPLWLKRLVLQLAHEQAAVITFNYDLLFERALANSGRYGSLGDLYAIPLEMRWPPGSSGFVSSSEPRGPMPRLFKLHGSINWHYGGLTSPATARIVLDDGGFSWAPRGIRVDDSPRYDVLLDDLEPLLVPPTAAKSTFYSNQSLRAQWRRAYTSLKQADELVVLGFSFPPSDVQVRQMILLSGPWDLVTVVDPSPEPARRVRELLGDSQEIQTFGSVLEYTDVTSGDIVSWGTDRDGDGYSRPLVTSNDDTLAEVAQLRNSGTPRDWDRAREANFTESIAAEFVGGRYSESISDQFAHRAESPFSSDLRYLFVPR